MWNSSCGIPFLEHQLQFQSGIPLWNSISTPLHIRNTIVVWNSSSCWSGITSCARESMEYVRTYIYLSVSWQYSNSTVAVGKYVCTARFFVMGPRPRLSLYSRERIKALLQGGASTAEIVDTLQTGRYCYLQTDSLEISAPFRKARDRCTTTKVRASN